jgi:hypothetical protein
VEFRHALRQNWVGFIKRAAGGLTGKIESTFFRTGPQRLGYQRDVFALVQGAKPLAFLGIRIESIERHVGRELIPRFGKASAVTNVYDYQVAIQPVFEGL